MPDKKIFISSWLLSLCVLLLNPCFGAGSTSLQISGTAITSAFAKNTVSHQISENGSATYSLSYQFPVAAATRFPAIRQSQNWQPSGNGWIREHMFHDGFWFGELPKVAWLKVSFSDVMQSRTTPIWLELASSGVSNATLYYQLPNGIWRSINNDAVYSSNAKYAPSRFISFPLLNELKQQPIYLRVEASNRLHLQVNVKENADFQSHNTQVDIIFAIGYGILLVMALYNLVIGSFLNDKLYYLYSGAIVTSLIYQFFAHGHARLFGNFNWDIVNSALNIFAMLSAFIATVFLYYFINFPQYVPKLSRYIRIFLYLFGVATLLTFVLPSNLSLNIALLIAGPTPLIAMTLAIIAWYHGSLSAKIFVYAWSVYIVGGFLWVLYWLGLVTLNLAVELPLLIGAALESILLSLALGYRIKLLREQSSQLQVSESHYKKISMTDGLTRLANRRAFDEQLAKLHTKNLHYSLVLLDIDHFKQFNDAYGHPAGDKVIRNLADILNETVRENDLAARIGGEEFALIIQNDDVKVAFNIAERIRVAFSKSTFHVNGKSVRCTVSIGVSSAQEEPQNIILERTDQALYRSKKLGRDQTQIAHV